MHETRHADSSQSKKRSQLHDQRCIQNSNIIFIAFSVSFHSSGWVRFHFHFRFGVFLFTFWFRFVYVVLLLLLLQSSTDFFLSWTWAGKDGSITFGWLDIGYDRKVHEKSAYVNSLALVRSLQNMDGPIKMHILNIFQKKIVFFLFFLIFQVQTWFDSDLMNIILNAWELFKSLGRIKSQNTCLFPQRILFLSLFFANSFVFDLSEYLFINKINNIPPTIRCFDCNGYFSIWNDESHIANNNHINNTAKVRSF